jgi:hypothetical protein
VARADIADYTVVERGVEGAPGVRVNRLQPRQDFGRRLVVGAVAASEVVAARREGAELLRRLLPQLLRRAPVASGLHVSGVERLRALRGGAGEPAPVHHA